MKCANNEWFLNRCLGFREKSKIDRSSPAFLNIAINLTRVWDIDRVRTAVAINAVGISLQKDCCNEIGE
jgi:hypothetical protein